MGDVGWWIAGGALALLGWGVECYSQSKHESAEELVSLNPTSLSEAAARVIGLDPSTSPLLAVRAEVAPRHAGVTLHEEGYPSGVAMRETSYSALSHAIRAGKLQKETKHLGTTYDEVPWMLVETAWMRQQMPDSLVKGAMLDGSMPRPPLTATIPKREVIEDPGTLQVKMNARGIRITDSRDTERVYAVERTASVLPVGALLTVVGRACLDSDGMLHFSAGVGPAVVTTQTLAEYIAQCRNSASTSHTISVLLLGGAAVAAGFGIYRWFRKQAANNITYND